MLLQTVAQLTVVHSRSILLIVALAFPLCVTYDCRFNTPSTEQEGDTNSTQKPLRFSVLACLPGGVHYLQLQASIDTSAVSLRMVKSFFWRNHHFLGRGPFELHSSQFV